MPRSLNLADLFEVVAEEIPDRLALACGDDHRTFGELDRRANQLARHLHECGVGKDAKVAIDAWNRVEWVEALIAAFEANDDEAKLARAQFKTDITTHVRAISDKYLIAGETQDTAFMFVPSEAIFADLHEQFEDLVQRATAWSSFPPPCSCSPSR